MARYQSGVVVYSTALGGITDLNVDLGTETASDDSGSFYDETRSIVRQDPTIGFTTKNIGGAIDLFGIPGVCIDGTPTLVAWANVLGDCKSPPLTTDNAIYTVALGLITLGTLSASRGEDATLSVMVDALTDGTNEPIAPDYAGNTIPGSIQTAQYTLGACSIAGVVVPDLSSLTLDFGVQKTSKTPLAGSVWPDSVAMRKCQPTLTLTGFDPRLWGASNIPTLGKAATHVNTVIQLKKRANLTTFVADGTAQHILITFGGLATVTNAFAGGANSEASITTVSYGVHDGTNVPVIVDTTSIYDPTP
jgi:hypothetical protein